LESDG
jgi:hypothetical protein